MLALTDSPLLIAKTFEATKIPTSTRGTVVCAAKGPRPRYPRVWKTHKKIGTISKAAKLVKSIKELSNVKEEVYGALDSYVAWELEFPLITVKKALKTLEFEQDWKRVIQITKWMLSKGQGKTMGSYFTLLNALVEDDRLDEAEELWTKLLMQYMESLPRRFFDKMISIYHKRGMHEKMFEIFADMEELCLRPNIVVVSMIGDAFKERGMLDKYLKLHAKYPYEHRHHRSDRNHKRDHKSRDTEGSKDKDRAYERESSRSKVKRDEEREYSHSHKRKEREHSEDMDFLDNKIRVSDERRERRKFGDKVKKEEDDAEEEDGGDNVRAVHEAKVKEEVTNFKDTASLQNGALGSPASVPPETSLTPPSSIPIKVSSNFTTNENKGLSITRSHEVAGKSSTDGPSSTAGKTGSFSIDALAKAKKALQMQKELSEKLKKIPQLNKSSTQTLQGSSNLGSKTESTMPSSNAGVALITSTSASMGHVANMSISASTASANPPATATSATGTATLPNFEAVRRAQELAARLGFRPDPQFAPLINTFPGQNQMVTDVAIPQKPTKAPVLRLDAQGREIDEHGNVVNVTKPSNLSTLKVNINKQKKDAFEILKPVLDVDPESNPHFDATMGINKTKLLRPKRMNFQFVEEGKWSRDAETIKLKSKFGEAQAKEHKAKQAQLAKAKAAPDINPNLIEITERVVIKEKPKDQIPEIEWWDVPLLHSGNYGDIDNGTIGEDKLKMEKITFYVEHPRPIEPPAEPAPPPPQPLKLTKQEQKKLRTQRRIAKEKERQEMIRQGVIEPPKPKVKISNLMKVLGTEATQDPTRLEKEIRSAAAEREQAHIDRNIARKLTPAELREKKERKLFDDPNTVETLVSLYKINDLSHPKARFRVDVNAQENRLTGCAVICDGISVVVVEGGNKSIKRYGKLMLRRINWTDVSKETEENEDSDDDKPINKCVLVWQGSVAKPSFNRFSVHDCITEAAGRKVFVDAGVPHYWDLAVNYVEDEAV